MRRARNSTELKVHLTPNPMVKQPATLIHFQLAAKIRTPIIVVHDDSVRSSSLSLNHKDILNFMARNFSNNRILQIPKNSS